MYYILKIMSYHDVNKLLFKIIVLKQHILLNSQSRKLTRFRFCQIEHSDKLLVAARRKESGILAEVDTLHDMIVLERVELLSAYGIPDFASEVGSSARCPSGFRIQGDTPNGTLVTLEGTDPVTSITLTQHRFPICNIGELKFFFGCSTMQILIGQPGRITVDLARLAYKELCKVVLRVPPESGQGVLLGQF